MIKEKRGRFLRIAMKTRLWLGLTAVAGLILAVMIVLTNLGWIYQGYINTFFGVVATSGTSGDVEDVYVSAYGELSAENSEALIEAEDDFNIRAMQEGTVMLRNEDNALPLLAEERRVTLFGNSVKDPVYATNSGGASFDSGRGGSLYDAFTSAGFAINDTLLMPMRAAV